MSLWSYIVPQTILTVQSPYNGTIRVVESFGKCYIEAGGLMQSGPFLERVWKNGIKKLAVDQMQVKHVLVLGLGGGSMIRLLQHVFPQTKITAVDIDPLMVELGEQYLGLTGNSQLTTIIGDAEGFIKKQIKHKAKYDLVFVDLYHGYKLASFVEDMRFLKALKLLLSDNGEILFNRLYFRSYKLEANKFLDKLDEIFQDVVSAQSYSNLLIAAK